MLILTNNYEYFKSAKHLSSTAKINHPWEFFMIKLVGMIDYQILMQL